MLYVSDRERRIHFFIYKYRQTRQLFPIIITILLSVTNDNYLNKQNNFYLPEPKQNSSVSHSIATYMGIGI